MKRTAWVALAVVLAGCSSGNASTDEAAEANCEQVSADLLSRLADGAEADVGDLSLSNGRAYRSPDYEQVYFVAADITAPGVDGDPAVWATNDLNGGGVFMAVDNVAQTFTTWPDANTTAAAIQSTDPAVSAAKDC